MAHCGAADDSDRTVACEDALPAARITASERPPNFTDKSHSQRLVVIFVTGDSMSDRSQSVQAAIADCKLE